MLVRWRGGVGPPLVALRRWRVLSEEARQQTALDLGLHQRRTGRQHPRTGSEHLPRPPFSGARTDDGEFTKPAHHRSMRRPGVASRLSAGRTDGVQNHRHRTLDAIQRLGKCLTVAVIQMQVVTAGLPGIKPDRFADDEGHGFRFEFARVT